MPDTGRDLGYDVIRPRNDMQRQRDAKRAKQEAAKKFQDARDQAQQQGADSGGFVKSTGKGFKRP